jgi:hypothetical protein
MIPTTFELNIWELGFWYKMFQTMFKVSCYNPVVPTPFREGVRSIRSDSFFYRIELGLKNLLISLRKENNQIRLSGIDK